MRRRTFLAVSFVVGAGLLISLATYFAVKSVSSEVEHAYVAFDVSPDDRQVVFSAADAHLYLFNLRTQQVRQLTRGTGLETDPAFSPDGKSIVYSFRVKEGAGAVICMRSFDGKQIRELTRGQTTLDTMPAYSSDGKQITFMRAARHWPYSMGGWTWDNYDVFVMNRDGSGLRQITRQSYYQADRPHFLNSKEIVFAGSGGYPDIRTYLYTVPADGDQSPMKFMPPSGPLSSDGSSPYYCAVWGSDLHLAPSGKQIVFISDRAQSYRYDLWIAGVSGGKARALDITRISSFNQEPVFTPNGDHILFLAGTEQNASSRPIFSLWEVDLAGSHAHRVADSGLFTNPLHWKPKP